MSDAISTTLLSGDLSPKVNFRGLSFSVLLE